MVIDTSVMRRVPHYCYGFLIFLVVNVYLLWGVALPTSHTLSVADYDAIILPFRLGASSMMAVVPMLMFALEVSVAKSRAHLQRALLPCAAFASVIGLLCFVGATISPYSALLYGLSGVLVGIGNACCFLLWGVVLARMSAEGCTFLLLLSGVGSGVFNLILFSVPSTLAYPIVAILLVMSLLGLQMSLNKLPETVAPAPERSRRARVKDLVVSLGQPLLCVCALGLAFNAFREIAFAQVGGTALVNTISMLGLIVGTGAVLGVLVLFKVKVPEVSGIYPLATLVVAACMIPFPFMPAEFCLPFVFVISVFYLLVETLFKGTMAQCVRISGESAMLTFSFGFGIEFAVMALGSYMGAIPRGESGENQAMFVIALALLCMYLLVVPLVSIRRKRRDRQAEAVAERIVIRPVAADELQQRCGEIAEHSGITQSELPVMTLLAAGQTVAAISRELSLSENTIRSHSKAIYRKLDIHSKQELIDLVAKHKVS